MKQLLILQLVILIGSSFLAAQETPTKPATGNAKKIDQLFDQIMLTFPDDIRDQVKSATEQQDAFQNLSPAVRQNKKEHKKASSKAHKEHKKTPSKAQKEQKKALAKAHKEQKKAMGNELSPELKKQVEKAIVDIEKKKKDRALQLKEYKEKPKKKK